jgi:outer membrane protein OmpA-like peptidoglycan-associated protein
MRALLSMLTVLFAGWAAPAAAHQWVSYFEPGRADLSARGFAAAREAAAYCRDRRCASVRIDAHTDTLEASRPGFDVDLQRGRAMLLELVRLDVPLSIITLRRHGGDALAKPTDAGVDEPLNRRVTVDVVAADPAARLMPPSPFGHSTMPTVYFAAGGTEVLPEWRFTLQLLAAQWRPGCRIHIRGRTDTLGTPQANQDLSERRAEGVARFLVMQGVPFEALRLSGAGERELSKPSADGVAERLNRTAALHMACASPVRDDGSGKDS